MPTTERTQAQREFAEATNTKHTSSERRSSHHTTARNGSMAYLALVQLSRGQDVGIVIDRVFLIVEVERGYFVGQLKIGLEERPNGADILPVALEDMGANILVPNQGRNDFLAEIGRIALQGLEHGLGVKDVDTHGGKALVAGTVVRLQLGGDKPGDHFRISRFFHEVNDLGLLAHSQQTKTGSLGDGNGLGRNGYVGPTGQVLFHHLGKIHAVKLVAGKNNENVVWLGMKVDQVSPDGIRRTLIPVVAEFGLLGGKNLHKALPEAIETIGILNVSVQRRRIELAEQINTVIAGIDAVAYGDVHQAIFARQRNGWLAP